MIDEKTKTIGIVWGIEDVQEVRPDLSDADAWQVLLMVEKHHDATIGVSWDTLECFADSLFPEVAA